MKKILFAIYSVIVSALFFWGFFYPEYCLNAETCEIDLMELPEGMTEEEWKQKMDELTPEEWSELVEQALEAGEVEIKFGLF